MAARVLFYPERFKDVSRYYTTGRPTYPPLLSRRVANLVGLARSENVLDLGTGPGFLAIDFAPLGRAVTAVDPSPEMLSAATQNARRAGVQIEFVRGSSYELGPQLGRFKLVTIGRAFHWMDRAATLASLDPLLEPGGAVALFHESYPEVPQNAWHKAFQEVVDRFSTQDPARPQIRSSFNHETFLLQSAFDHLERVSVIEVRDTPVERFVDRALSFASTWQTSDGAREPAIAADIRAALARFAGPDGNVREVLEGHALVARRSKDLAGSVPGRGSASAGAPA